MDNYWWCTILFRIYLPLVIAIVIFMRPTISSYLYLIMGCYSPFFSTPTKQSMSGGTLVYMKILVIISTLTSSMVISFYFALFYSYDRDPEMEPCKKMEILIRTLGVVEMKNLAMIDLMKWCLPEPLMLISSVALHLLFKKMCRDSEGLMASMNEEQALERTAHIKIKLDKLLTFGKYFVIFLLCMTAILKPAFFGGIYYVFFLTVMTFWACNQQLGRTYARLLLLLVPVMFCHLTIIFGYQLQYFQDSPQFLTRSVLGRLFHLIDLNVYKDCTDPRIFEFRGQSKASYALPIFLFVSYYVTVLIARELLEAKDGVLNTIKAVFTKGKKTSSKKFLRAYAKIQERKRRGKSEKTSLNKLIQFTLEMLECIMSASHLAANFMLMIWAVVFVSWKELNFLLYATIVLLLPYKKKVFLYTSPIIVLCMWFVLLTAFLYSMEMTTEELSEELAFFNFASGVEFYNELTWIRLLTRSLFAVVIFISIRQLLQQRSVDRIRKSLSELGVLEEEETKYELFDWFKEACLDFFAIRWIWIVMIMMIFMEFWSTSNLFRIAFVAQAIFINIMFQLLPFVYWKILMRIFLWFITVYTMLNVFIVYLYQIEFFRNILYSYFGHAVFERFDFVLWESPSDLTQGVAPPIFLELAVVILQNYLFDRFDKLSSQSTPEEVAKEEKAESALGPRRKMIKTFYTSCRNALFGFLEVHLSNMILLVGWYMCAYDMSAMFLPIVLLLTVACLLGGILNKIIIHFVAVLVQIIIIMKLLYMDQYDEHEKWNYVGYYMRNGKTYNTTLNTADWVGLRPSRFGSKYADFGQLSLCFLYVFMVTIMGVLKIRMYNYRTARNIEIPKSRIMFQGISRENSHESIGNMVKYLLNFIFLKLGVEICFVFASFVASRKMDASAIFITIWLMLMFALNRKLTRIFWWPTMVILVFAIPLEYSATLGFWPQYWELTLVKFWNKSNLLIRIQQFCHLMNMAHPPIKDKITLDFWLLLMISRQWRSFRKEWQLRGRYSAAGDNDNKIEDVDKSAVDNPVPDFVTYARNSLDIIKNIFFYGWFFTSLLMAFLAGAMRPTLISFGYILSSFFIAWDGTDFFLRHPKAILRRWNLLIAFNILVMITRTVQQIFGCILIHENVFGGNCHLYKWFSVGCVEHYPISENIPNLPHAHKCGVTFDSLGLGWDCACFLFLIFQQRIFKSQHFHHLVNETKAQKILASRGFKKVEEQRKKKRQALDAQDAQIRENIKKKMEKIRATHQRVQGEVYARRKKNHTKMLKSSDYYLFDDLGLKDDIPLLPPKIEKEKSFDPIDPMNLTEFFTLCFKTDIDTVLKERYKRRQLKQNLRLKKRVGPPIPYSVSKIKLLRVMVFLYGGFEAIIVSLTGFINHKTINFRAVLREIGIENRILKEKTDYHIGMRLGSHKIWTPSDSYTNILDSKLEQSEDLFRGYSIYAKLIRALWYLFLAHSEWLCYLVMILNQTIRSIFISVPLMIITFCWGALTIPNPSKTYWITSISYVLIMITIQIAFRMDTVPWNIDIGAIDSFLFYPPRVIGVGFWFNSGMAISLLVVFFFHRMVLNKLGQWRHYVYRNEELIEDGNYSISDGKFVPLTSKNEKKGRTLEVNTGVISIGGYFPDSIKDGAGKYGEHFRLFIQQLIHPSCTQIPVDVYTPMFFCDLVNLLILLFFYGYFTINSEEEAEGFIEFMRNNRVPLAFLVTFLMYFFLMVIDRALYVRKNLFGKLIYYYMQVLAIHIFCFILYPFLSGRKFSRTPVIQTFYFFKCIYFLFSAYQIRNGYPPLISSHCLWSGTTIFNRYGYKLYTVMPYFFEIRTLLDWICSDSCLGFQDWFIMEDITQNIFDQFCEQELDEKLEKSAGRPKSRKMKFWFGGILYLFLILTVIFPFLLFCLGGTVGVTTHPAKIKLELYMGSSERIFRSYASEHNLHQLSEHEYKDLTSSFNNIDNANEMFGSFKANDVVVVKWSPHSLTKWQISPGSFDKTMAELKSDQPFKFNFHLEYTHIGHGGLKEQKTYGQSTIIPPLPNRNRENLIEMMKSPKTVRKRVLLPLVFPKFLKITKEAVPVPLAIMEEKSVDEEDVYRSADIHQHLRAGFLKDDVDYGVTPDRKAMRSLLLSLRENDEGERWWYLQEECITDDDNYFNYLKGLVQNSCEVLVMYTFNEKVFSESMNFITSSGIFGLYVIYFMVAIGLIRGLRINTDEIWIEDLPNSNEIMRKCMEVYTARDMQNYELEEELYAQLIFIMRSKEVLIKLTRQARLLDSAREQSVTIISQITAGSDRAASLKPSQESSVNTQDSKVDSSD